ncbi:MAG: VWA domain-containing protein, partial [Gammaproteobacteria bacterium]
MRIFLVLCCLAAMNAASAIPADIVLVLDNSGSMRKNDPEFLLKRAVARFVNSLEAGSRLGIVVFDAAVNVAVPLHELDVETRAEVQSSLDGIDYSGQLTNSPAAVERAIYELRTAGRGDIPRVIVFMTDGIVDTGDAGADLEKARW